MNFRFRKSLTIIPGILKWTVSKKSTSLNLNLGIFSRSWGTRGTTTTLDMPGTSGIFWRSEKRRRKDPEQAKARAQREKLGLPSPAQTQPASLAPFIILMIAQGLIWWAWGTLSCDHAVGRSVVMLIGVQAMVYTLVRVMNRIGSMANILLLALLALGSYFAATSWIVC
jgi:hypothetical protein